jgi:hypothetical protein
MSLNPLDHLRNYAKGWVSRVRAVIDADVPSDMVSEKMALITKAKKIKEMIESVAGSVDELAPLNSLGLWPLLIPLVVGGATVAGAIAAINSWDTEYDMFVAKTKEVDKLVAESGGKMSRDQAHQIVNATAPKPKMTLTSMIPLLAIGAGILFFVLR